MELASLRGLVSEEVGLRLADLASEVDPARAIVEIGSFKGKSTCYLAEGAAEGRGAKVWAVDPWDLPGNPDGKHGYTTARQDFDAQTQQMGLAWRITPVQGFSTAVAASWDSPVGLLYIDGSHTYQDVRDDWQAWWPHLASEAVVVFDDYGTKKNPGVTKLVDELSGAGELLRLDLDTPPLAVGRADR